MGATAASCANTAAGAGLGSREISHAKSLTAAGHAGRKGSWALRQKLSWERVPGGLDVPDADVGDPPARAVPEEFEAVDGTAFDRSHRGGCMFRGAQQVRDIARTMGNAMNFVLVEGFATQRGIAGVHKFLMGHGLRGGFSGWVFADDDKPHVGNIERSVAVPLAGLVGGPGNDFVIGFDDAVER